MTQDSNSTKQTDIWCNKEINRNYTYNVSVNKEDTWMETTFIYYINYIYVCQWGRGGVNNYK